MDFAPADVDRVGRFWRAPRIATTPGPQGGRPVRGGRPRRDQGGLDHGDQSGRQPAQRRCGARCARELRVRDRLRGDPRHRHRRCLPHPPAGARLGGEGRHRHQLRARHLAPAAVPAGARRGAAGLVDRRARSPSAWASATAFAWKRRGRHLPRARARCRPSRTTARAISTSVLCRASAMRLRRAGAVLAVVWGGWPLLRRRRLLPCRPARALRRDRAACAGPRARSRAAAAAQHRPRARPVAHHDAHRKVGAARRPSARADGRAASARCRGARYRRRRHRAKSTARGAVRCCARTLRRRYGRARPSRRCTGRRRSRAPAASTPRSIRRSIRSPASPSSSTRPSKSAPAVRGMARFSLADR